METFEPSQRSNQFFILVGVLFLLLLGRLVQLQLLYSDVYGKKSEENSIRPIAHDPIRGFMFDRTARLLAVDSEFIMERVQKGRMYNRFAPAKIKRDIDFPTLSAIEENRDKLPGVDYQIESKRYYPTGAKAAHLFGYTKEITDQQLTTRGEEYHPGDLVGATGLEADRKSTR